jgi:hypothetical protein
MAFRIVRFALAEDASGSRVVRHAAPFVAALATLLCPPLLRQTFRPEVYSLALALTLYGAHALQRFAAGDGRGLERAALVAGLAFGVHPPHALVVTTLGLVAVVAFRRDVLRRPRAIALAALFGVAGASVVAYLPLRAAAGASLWGDATTVPGLWAYVTGLAYRPNLGAGETSAASLLAPFAYVAQMSGGTAVLGLAFLAARAGRAKRGDPLEGSAQAARFLTLAPAVALVAGFLQPLFRTNPDNVAYLAPATVLLAIAGTVGFALPVPRSKRSWWLAALALPVALNPAGVARLRALVPGDAPPLETLSGMWTQTVPERSLVVVQTDFVAASWMMAQAVDGARPDVALFAEGLATSSWHWESLAPHPAFDGRPVRGPGRSAKPAYVAGALRQAEGRVPIASERPLLRGGRGLVAGPAVLYPAQASPETGTPARAAESTGERLAPHFDRELARASGGDEDLVGDVGRHYQLGRARRLLRRGQPRLACRALGRALFWLPQRLRRAIATATPSRHEPVPVKVPRVRAPTTMLLSRRDAEREAAITLWRYGEADLAFAILEHQASAGDLRALLQLAYLHRAAGATDQARAVLDTLRRRAPELAPEARSLQESVD